MRGLLILGLAVAGAYYAHKQGYLPQLAPVVAAGDAMLRRASFAPVPQSEWDRGERARGEYTDRVRAASGGQIVPILGRDEVVTVNAYEGMLRRHYGEVSGWAKRNLGYAAAIAKIENSGMVPDISGDNGTSHGVYQVKAATAETCYRAGYTRHAPTRENLLKIGPCIYFGTAEMERLSRINSDPDWIIQAYNGGAGFQKMSEKYQRDRAKYLQKVKRAFAGLYGGAII